MDEQLQDLIDQLRDIAPSLRSMSGTAGSTNNNKGELGTDKIVMAIGKLAGSLDKNTKNKRQEDASLAKFVKDLDKSSAAAVRNKAAADSATKAQTEATKAQTEAARRSTLTQDARDREDTSAARSRRRDSNRDAAQTIRQNNQVRTGAAELADEYIKGLSASKLFNRKLEDMAGESVASQLAVRAMSHSIKTAGQTLKDFTSGLGTFGKGLANGEASFESLNPLIDSVANGLAQLADAIPFAGGALSATVRLVAEGSKFVLGQLQQASTAFNELGQVGALTADGMTGVYKGFLESGMQLKSYTSVVQANAMQLARFGGTVGQGTAKLSNFLGTIVDSRAGDELRRIGYSTDQIGETAAAFLGQQTRLGIAQQKTQKQLATESTEYAKQIDLLARVTGQQRNDIIKQQDSALSEGRFRAVTDGMISKGADGAARALLLFQNQISAVSPELGSAVRDTASGFVNSEAAIKGFNSSGGAIIGIVDALKSGQITTAQAMERLQDATQGAEDRQRTFATAVGDGQSVFVKYAELSDFNRASIEGSTIKASAAQESATSGQDKLTDSTVIAQRNMEQLGRQLNNFGFQVMPQAAEAVSMFTGALNEFVNYVSKELAIDLPNISAQLADMDPAAISGQSSATTAVPPRPTTSGHAGRNARSNWDNTYGRTHNEDGSLKNAAEVIPGNAPAAPGVAPVAPVAVDTTPVTGTIIDERSPRSIELQRKKIAYRARKKAEAEAYNAINDANRAAAPTITPGMAIDGDAAPTRPQPAPTVAPTVAPDKVTISGLDGNSKTVAAGTANRVIDPTTVAPQPQAAPAVTFPPQPPNTPPPVDASSTDGAAATQVPELPSQVPGSLIGMLKSSEGYGTKIDPSDPNSDVKAYPDFKQYSIGFGTKGYKGEVITHAQAEQRLMSMAAGFRSDVLDKRSKFGYNWDEQQVDALTSFAYNLGSGAINQVTANGTRDNATIAQKMVLYNKAGGQFNQGLYDRRLEEQGKFNSTNAMPKARNGGIMSGAPSGYPVEMHGTEAVVPLPDGKSIPVTMGNMGRDLAGPVNATPPGPGTASFNRTAEDGASQLSTLTSLFSELKDSLQSQDRQVAEGVSELVVLQRANNNTSNKLLMNSQG